MIRKKIQLLFETEVKVIINVFCLKAVGKWILVFLSGSKTGLLKEGKLGLVFKRRRCWRYWGSL